MSSTDKTTNAGAASTSKDAEMKDQPAATNANALPQLNALEDDDEFEEFTAEDWKDDETDMGVEGQPKEQLWEDNWDDDEEGGEGDSFGNQLRAALANPSGPTAMQT